MRDRHVRTYTYSENATWIRLPCALMRSAIVITCVVVGVRKYVHLNLFSLSHKHTHMAHMDIHQLTNIRTHTHFTRPQSIQLKDPTAWLALHQLIYDQFISSVLKIISRLNLSAAPVFQGDHEEVVCV